MTGSIVQISVSPGGVPKLPVEQARVTRLGLEGDGHANTAIHGGPQRAVLLITAEGIDELTARGFPLAYGSLGENLTTTGMGRRDWRVGQRFQIGAEALIQITRLRAPCQTLSVYGTGIQAAVYDALGKAGDPSSPKWGLGGFYASVLTPGLIRLGDSIALVSDTLE